MKISSIASYKNPNYQTNNRIHKKDSVSFHGKKAANVGKAIGCISGLAPMIGAIESGLTLKVVAITALLTALLATGFSMICSNVEDVWKGKL